MEKIKETLKDKRKNRIITISFLIVFLLASIVIIGRNVLNARAYTLTTGSNGSGLAGRPIGDFKSIVNGTTYTTDSSLNTYTLDNMIVFCLEPGINANTDGNAYSQSDMNSLSSVRYKTGGSGSYNTVSVTDFMRKSWSLISYFYETNPNNLDATYLRAASQAIIWEVSTGGRTSFDSEVPNVYNGSDSFYASNVANASSTQKQHFATSYRAIVEYVKNNFDQGSTKELGEKTMNYSNGSYSTTIDTGINLSSYDCGEHPGLGVTVDGTNITITSSDYFSGTKEVTCNGSSSSYGGLIYTAANSQTLVHGYLKPSQSIHLTVKTNAVSITVTKTDPSHSYTTLNGAVFSLYSTSGDGVDSSNLYTTINMGNSNTATATVVPGWYKVVETTVPRGYKKMNDQWINVTTTNRSFTFTDEPIKITFKKVDSKGNPLTEPVFNIYDSSGTVKEFHTVDSEGCYVMAIGVDDLSDRHTDIHPNSNGIVCLKRLDLGSTYTVKESVTPSQYKTIDDFQIVAPTDTEGSKDYGNKIDESKTLTFYKEDADSGKRINGAGFTVTNSGTTVTLSNIGYSIDGCYDVLYNGKTPDGRTPENTTTEVFTNTSINNGEVCLNYVTENAIYVLTESTVPTGYQKIDPTIVKEGNNGNIFPLTSDKPLKLYLYKKDAETGAYINGAGFTVTSAGSQITFSNKGNTIDGCYDILYNGKTPDGRTPSSTTREVFTDASQAKKSICLNYVKEQTEYVFSENTVPTGYQKINDVTITAGKNNETTNIFERQLTSDNALKIKFYKEDALTGVRINNAGFAVYEGNSTNKLTFGFNNDTKCYELLDGSGNTNYGKNYSSSQRTQEVFTNTSINNGEVCLSYVKSATTYRLEETTVPLGYTKMKDAIITATVNSNIATNISGPTKEIDYPTMLEFTKNVSDDTSASDSTITQLVDIAKFEITKEGSNTPLKFINKGNGEYWYSTSGTITQLNTTNRKFIVKYLPAGSNYNITEAEYTLTESEKQIVFNNTGTSYSGVIRGVPGYYYDNETTTFTMNTNNNGQYSDMPSVKASKLNNLVTINFEKKDIYEYYSKEDQATLESDTKLLDTAKFVLRDSNGNILSLKKVSNGIYRYLPVNSNNTVSEINTYKGNLKITHLLNNTTYYIEEVKTTTPANFILPTNVTKPNGIPSSWDWKGHPYVIYNINQTSPSSTSDTSITQVIENIPTRVKIEKRNLKTGKLINDETVRFKLYKIENGQENQIYVTQRELIDGEYAYKYSKLNAQTDVNITTYKGYIVFRYLPAGDYVLKETKAPKGYDLPTGESAKTYFSVSSSSVDLDAEVIKNKPSKIILTKYSESGDKINGALFRLYMVEKDKYDENLSVENNAKINGTILNLKTIQDGEYEYKDVKDTNQITTCTKNCSSIGENTGDAGSIEKGMLQVEYLETDNYYIFEEIKAPKGHSLPEDPFTVVYLPESSYGQTAQVEIENKYTPVTFYKFDEYNKLLDGAKYKLQKLNKDKKYEDITVSKVQNDEESVYEVNFNTDDTEIITKDGQATIYLLTEGQYRILETQAAEGYELPKASINVATFFVTSEGQVKGNFIITNKKPTEKNVKLNKATSELLLSIQTGNEVRKYSIIIFGLTTIIGLLIFFKVYFDRKKNKEM